MGTSCRKYCRLLRFGARAERNEREAGVTTRSGRIMRQMHTRHFMSSAYATRYPLASSLLFLRHIAFCSSSLPVSPFISGRSPLAAHKTRPNVGRHLPLRPLVDPSYLVHGVCVLHGLVMSIQDSRRGHVLGRRLPGWWLVPEREVVDGVGGVEVLQRHLRRRKGAGEATRIHQANRLATAGFQKSPVGVLP